MRPIRIAAALIENGRGEMLLVRKAGTRAFMQAGGKIEPHEQPIEALGRELAEELNWAGDIDAASYLGCFKAAAANEPGQTVEAELFLLRARGGMRANGEIDAMVWVNPTQARALDLAPLTQRCVLPLFEDLLRQTTPAKSA